jgi:hypothetical protein
MNSISEQLKRLLRWVIKKRLAVFLPSREEKPPEVVTPSATMQDDWRPVTSERTERFRNELLGYVSRNGR